MNDWVFRGQGTQGIGQGDGGHVARGEQFLSASSVVAQDRALLKAIRPWMTLDARDADHRAVEQELEAWSYVYVQRRPMVVRMVSNPLFQKYDRRAAYFSQAWIGAPDDDLILSLGRATDFEPAGDPDVAPAPSAALTAHSAAPPDLESEVFAVAERLLAHFLDAIASNGTVVISAPIVAFRQRSPLPVAIGLAAATLPAPYRAEFPIRCFTRNPRLFASARAVALPEESLTDSFEVYPRRVVLNAMGESPHGVRPSGDAKAYAMVALRSARVMPAAVLRLSRDAGRHVRPPAPIPPSLVEVAHLVSFLSYASTVPASSFDTFRQLVPQLPDRTTLPLAALLTKKVWASASDSDLRWVLTTTDLPDMVTGENAQDDRSQLRSACIPVAIARGLQVQASALPSGPHRLDHAAWLTSHGLMSTSHLASLSSTVATGALPGGTGLAQVLRAEAKEAEATGLPWTRADDPQALARQLAIAPALLEDAVRWSDSGALSADWLGEFADFADRPARLELAEQLFAAVAKSSTQRDSLLARAATLASRMVAESDPLGPSTLNAALGLARALPEGGSPHLVLDLLELLARAGARGVTGRSSLPGWIHAARDEQTARAVVTAALDPSRQALREEDVIADDRLGFDRWTAHVIDLIVNNWASFESTAPRTAVRLLHAAVKQGPDGRENSRARVVLLGSITRTINEASELHWRATADALIGTGLWLPFSSSDALSASGRRRLALGWLGAASARSRSAPTPIEEWEWVRDELARPDHGSVDPENAAGLTAAEVRATLDGGTARWPWIPRFERTQLRDLFSLAADLEALALLLDAIVLDATDPHGELAAVVRLPRGPSGVLPSPELVENALETWAEKTGPESKLWQLQSPTGLGVLVRDVPRPGERLLARDLLVLYSGSGAAAPRVAARLTVWLNGDSPRDPELIRMLLRLGRERGLWSDAEFLQHGLTWFRSAPFDDDLPLLQALNGVVEGMDAPTWREPPNERASAIAEKLLTQHKLRGLASLIDRRLLAGRIQYFEYGDFPDGLVRFLLFKGKSREGESCRAAFRARVRASRTAVAPVAILNARLLALEEHIRGDARRSMHRLGPSLWMTFIEAHPEICHYDVDSGTVPALEVLFFLESTTKYHHVANDFLRLPLTLRATGRGLISEWQHFLDSLQWWKAIFATIQHAHARHKYDDGPAVENVLGLANERRYRLRTWMVHTAFSTPTAYAPPSGRNSA